MASLKILHFKVDVLLSLKETLFELHKFKHFFVYPYFLNALLFELFCKQNNRESSVYIRRINTI